jgi:hypothetical protein
MPPDRGVFLTETRRMQPDVAGFIWDCPTAPRAFLSRSARGTRKCHASHWCDRRDLLWGEAGPRHEPVDPRRAVAELLDCRDDGVVGCGEHLGRRQRCHRGRGCGLSRSSRRHVVMRTVPSS